MLALQLACAQTSSVTLLVFMKQLKALTKAADVCSAARMRPDPDLPAFSLAPPPRVARALLQYLALLMSALCQRHQEARVIQSVALSASKRRERTSQQDVQQQLTSKVVAAAIAKEISRASYHEEHGRPVPAGLPLQLKLNEANIKDLVGEFVAVAPSGSACIRHIGWTMVLALLSCTGSCKVLWSTCPSSNCLNSCAEREPHLFRLMLKREVHVSGLVLKEKPHLFALLAQEKSVDVNSRRRGHFMCLECMQKHTSMSNLLRCSLCKLNE